MTVPITNDNLNELQETFEVTIGSLSPQVLILSDSATVIILDDDAREYRPSLLLSHRYYAPDMNPSPHSDICLQPVSVYSDGGGSCSGDLH